VPQLQSQNSEHRIRTGRGLIPVSNGKREVPNQASGKCDGCGKPIGHANSIEAEYDEITPEDEYLDSFFFGDKACKENFEEHHEVNHE